MKPKTFELSDIEKPSIIITEKPPKNIAVYTHYYKVLNGLKNGDQFCFKGSYGNALSFYSWLKEEVTKEFPIIDYNSSRLNRKQLYDYSQNLLVKIFSGKINLSKSPDIKWLSDFYKEKDFYLRFTDVLGLNGSWQWYKNGIRFNRLKQKLHPFYGTYFPTRTEHLELFDKWLKDNGKFDNAIDIGTGCGVLTFYMLKHGVKRITATDINPNAIYSLSNDLSRHNKSDMVNLKVSNLFGELDEKDYDLAVFNPPWIPEEPSSTMDKAMYYQKGFFETFFQEASAFFKPGTTLIILFSTFAEASGLTSINPIEEEIKKNERFKLVGKTEMPVKQKSSAKKHWLNSVRSNEKIELWELKRI